VAASATVPPPSEPVRLAIVGCGAMTRLVHLPGLARRSDCRVVALVDRDGARARVLAERYEVPQALTDHRHLRDVDAAIVSVPNHLHASVTIDLLHGGMDVLVEKPLTITTDEADEVITAARSSDAILAVGHLFRYADANRLTKAILDSGLIGEVTAFEIRNGVDFSWPVATTYLLQRATAGGGVLMDLGPHTFDLLLWWLGDVADVRYRDDSYGGVEADAEVRLTMVSGATGSVTLSRTRDLRARAAFYGARAQLEVAFTANDVRLILADGSALDGHANLPDRHAVADQHFGHFGVAEHDDFLTAVREQRPPMVTGEEARRSLALIETCYAIREPLELPWVKPTVALRG
jgi:predicted dehydrogenase